MPNNDFQGITINTPQHTWQDVTFVLDRADPSFDQKCYVDGSAVSYDSFSSHDGGKTWVVPIITVPASNCTGDN